MRRWKIRLLTAEDDPMMDNTPERQLHRSIVDAMSEYERALIGQRTKDALAALKRRGVKLGRKGYQDSEAGKDLMQLIRAMSEKGFNSSQIAKRLNGAGVKSLCGKRWYKTTVSRILESQP